MIAACWLAALAIVAVPAAADDEAIDPATIKGRPELIGKSILLDDRFEPGSFQFKRGVGFFQFELARVPGIAFRLRPQQALKTIPRQPGARVRGSLRRDAATLVFDVSGLELVEGDRERLDAAVAALAPGDYAARTAWAAWAEARASAFQDDELAARARQVEAQALAIEADRPAADPPAHWLRLADRAKARKVEGPLAGALAHRAFRARLNAARTADDLAKLAEAVATFFPDAAKPPAGAPTPEAVATAAAWEAAYQANPSKAYTDAPPLARAGFDRDLVADALERDLDRRAADAPEQALALAEQASSALPDRPAVADRLERIGLERALADPEALREAEVIALAARFARRGDPGRGDDLIRRWLDDQRSRRLGPADAEGRVILAEKYERLLKDRAAAADLLRNAWRIDPETAGAADGLRRLGYRKESDDWVANVPGPATPPDRGRDRDTVRLADSLRGLTRDQILERLGGPPDRVARSFAQGQFVEQWIYRSAKGRQFINFLQPTSGGQARVVGHFTLP